jgi:hypothetical protein
MIKHPAKKGRVTVVGLPGSEPPTIFKQAQIKEK